MEYIKYEEFRRLDIRVGKIKSVKDHPNANKLYVVELDDGKDGRTLIAGLKEYYKPEELEGKYVIFIANLEPKPLRGITSQGMLLAADDGNIVALLEPDKDIKVGSRVR